MKKLVRHFPDIRYSVVMTEKKEGQCFVEFTTHELAGSDETGSMLFYRKGAKSNATEEEIDDINEAEIYLEGSVKWDGCSNMVFREQERVMLHFCEKKEAQNIGVLMGYIYDMAEELISEYCG